MPLQHRRQHHIGAIPSSPWAWGPGTGVGFYNSASGDTNAQGAVVPLWGHRTTKSGTLNPRKSSPANIASRSGGLRLEESSPAHTAGWGGGWGCERTQPLPPLPPSFQLQLIT